MKQKLLETAAKSKIGNRLIQEQRYRVIFSATLGFFLNLLYAVYNGILGARGRSLWFAAMCAYYIILGATRFAAVLCERKNNERGSLQTEFFVTKFSGIMLAVLSVVLAGVIYISLSQHIAAKYDEIMMIAIAAYTFGKITMAIIRAVKQRNHPSPLLAAIRSIGYAEVAASVLTLQRSMLVSFGAMGDRNAHILNMATGGAVCLFVLGLGIALFVKKERMDPHGKIEVCKGE